MDYAAQSRDPCFARAIHGLESMESMDLLRYPWIAQPCTHVRHGIKRSAQGSRHGRQESLHHQLVCREEDREQTCGKFL